MPTTLSTQQAVGSLATTVNYSVDTDQRPQINNADQSRNVMSLAPREVAVVDADAIGLNTSLVREGFTKVDHSVDLEDVTTSSEAAERYRQELVPLMLELTGADEIILNPFSVVRRQASQAGTLGDPVPVSDPVNYVHTDFSLIGARGGEVHYRDSYRPNVRRKAMLNMWRLLSLGPTNLPLALCDSQSVDPADIIPGDSVFPDGSSFETAFVRYNEDHRWFYFPELTAEQMIVFKQSDTDDRFPRLVPHTAIKDNSRTPAANRVSIESRCLAVWFD